MCLCKVSLFKDPESWLCSFKKTYDFTYTLLRKDNFKTENLPTVSARQRFFLYAVRIMVLPDSNTSLCCPCCLYASYCIPLLKRKECDQQIFLLIKKRYMQKFRFLLSSSSSLVRKMLPVKLHKNARAISI